MNSAWPCLARGHAGRAGDAAERTLLRLAVVPGARKTGVDGFFDGALRVRLAAPPVEGQANEALIAWLTGELDLPRRALVLVQGPHSRRKTVAIDAPMAAVQAWLEHALAAGENGSGRKRGGRR